MSFPVIHLEICSRIKLAHNILIQYLYIVMIVFAFVCNIVRS